MQAYGKMKGKRGWVRIIEVTVTIIIIIGAMILVSNSAKPHSDFDITENMRSILEEAARNESLRSEILFSSKQQAELKLTNFFKSRIASQNIRYQLEVCSLESSCVISNPQENLDSDLYSLERIVSSSKSSSAIDQKKVKLFFWVLQ